VELKEEATWYDLKIEIEKVTGILAWFQKVEPYDHHDKKCNLEEGEDVFCNWELIFGNHPLHCAAYKNKEVIKSWLASGADINIKNVHGETPLMYASKNSKEECVVELLSLGANVHVIDKIGNTVLHCVACNGDMKDIEKTVKTLIKAGCNPKKRNNENMTFIDIIKKRNHNELATRLEEWIKEK
jgi:ankyrin repeat protein